MGIFGDSAGLRLIVGSWFGCERGSACALPCGIVVLAALGLAGCAANDSAALLIDPGRYELFKCDDLAARWKLVSGREKELRALMDRASQTGGGAVVGALTYRTEYETVLSDERLLQRTAAAKNCPLSFQVPGQVPGAAPQPVPMGSTQNPLYQSDQGIR